MDALPGLDSAADELYSLDPADFVTRRDELVKDARAAKDRALANAIKALRRPTVGAWYLNVAARAGLTSLFEWLRLGRELRDAQAALDFKRVVALAPKRADVERRVLRDLAAHLAALGVTASPAGLEEVRTTLRAALADPDAAAAVEAGRLAKPLEYGAFGDGLGLALGASVEAATEDPEESPEPEVTDEPALSEASDESASSEAPEESAEPDVAQPEVPKPEASDPITPPNDELDELDALDRAAAEAEEALRNSQAALEAVKARRERLVAQRALGEATSRVQRAERAVGELGAVRDDLAARLAQAEDDLGEASAELAAARTALEGLRTAAETPRSTLGEPAAG